MAHRRTTQQGLTISEAVLRPPKDPDADLRVSFLEMVVEDPINCRRYNAVLVGTPRGLTFTVTLREDLTD